MSISNFTSSYENISEKCVPLKKDFVVFLTSIPALVAMENLVFLTAVTLRWRSLKQSNVYRYVISTFAANFFISILGFYHFFNYYFGFEPQEPNLWWAFRKGMLLALSLVVCGNIGLLIYGIHDSTYIVSRKSKNSNQFENLNAELRKRKANILISFVWFMPTAYGLLAMTSWNCTSGQCTCTLSYKSGHSICKEMSCSNLYTPMAKSYLLVVVLLWGLQSVGLLVMFSKSILKLKRIRKSLMEPSSLFQAFKESISKFSVVYILFVLFFVCTAPEMTLFALDFAISGITFKPALVNFLLPLPLIYCFISPFLLMRKLSGVRSALLLGCRLPSTKRSFSRRPKSRKRSERPMSISAASRDFKSSFV